MLGRVGIRPAEIDSHPWAEVVDAVAEFEDLGYGTVWTAEGFGRDAPTQAALLLSATSRITVASGVANIYRHNPHTLAQAQRTLTEAFPDRYLLGLGVGVPHLAEMVGRTWGPPGATMRDFLDRMDAALFTATPPNTRLRTVLGAVGPRMLALAGERTWGAHPYFLPAEHTAHARQILGPDKVLAVQQGVVLNADRSAARETARENVRYWIEHSSQLPSRWHAVRDLLGFTEDDLADGGSDRLVDAMVAHGDVDAVAHRVQQQFAAGADHVCVEILSTPGAEPTLARKQYAELAAALI
ncbi:TIGR03620 family F420-dependent LLM class oxidoreductase [Streptomyces sp. ML-6]|uniref:TIGR03620 family F420-dependent LLM class oxidoreductase n=1 Tax=Streptomyces sp. ML-6 TaxID=2982693 RepID=UPI0024BF83AD|nr:TIGR03620 family F420-dependent LLM class oxidoreductase [Streptomyces sp. ML-6]MDK0524167.1 TIGR03620 family F420-dependent LLM class oxidoreductase [Streptomyces sp. ML-6]